jgi:hypothetical protein
VLWRKGGQPGADVIVFLHGWGAAPPSSYGYWLEHLARRGATIVYPVIQDASTSPEAALSNALAGIRAGIGALPKRPRRVEVIGHTTGGLLAFDYAALAHRVGLPVATSTIAIYPGRYTGSGYITIADLGRIPRATHLLAMAGASDPVPGGRVIAWRLLLAAKVVPPANRHYVSVEGRGLVSPALGSAASRREFWAPADRFLAG